MSAPDALSVPIWDDDVGARELVRLLRDHPRSLPRDRARQSREHVEPELGVLVEDRDPCLRPRLQDRPPVHASLAAVALEEAHRPRIPREAPSDRLRAVAGEELRHLLRVQVVAHREVVRRADRVEDRENLVLLDEPPRQLDRLRRVVRVVVVAVLDLPAVHAALRVDVVEVGPGARADASERRGFARERDGSTEKDGRGRDAGIRRGCGACRRDERQRGEGDGRDARGHFVTGVRRPGSLRIAVPTRARAVCAMGRSR